MTDGNYPGSRLAKPIIASADGSNAPYENGSEPRNAEKTATTEFIRGSRRKFQVILAIGAIAIGCHVIAYILKYIGHDPVVIGIFQFIEYVAAIGDAIWIVVLIVCEVCNAITEMLTGRFKMIAFGVVLFASGAVLSPYIQSGLLHLLRKAIDLLGH